MKKLLWYLLFLTCASVPGAKAAGPIAGIIESRQKPYSVNIVEEITSTGVHLPGGNFVIRGNITSLPGPVKIVFSYENSTDTQYKGVHDTVNVTGGKFIYQGFLNYPTDVTVYLMKNGIRVDPNLSPESSRYFFLDKGTITMKGKDLKTAAIKGCAIEQTWEDLQQKTASITDNKEKEKAHLEFVRANPDSYVSWAIVKKYRMVSSAENEMAMNFYNAMSEGMKNTMDGQKFLKTRERLGKGPAIMGRVAPDFARNDVNGNPIALSSLRGKYVFLEFWASWCGYCRAESPYVKTAYGLFRDKNFEVFAVSFDDKKKNWEDAIAKDSLLWLNVSKLTGMENDDVSIMYGINMVPRNYLLDPNGVIIAIDLRGKQLEEKLREILGNPDK